jgi:2-keto-3-deoxy-L-rhamnonate aldolase RhmA
LDAGATGLIFSTIEDLEQCERVKEYCWFPSHGGRRGLGLVRENKWGSQQLVSDPPVLIAQIETHKAVRNIDEIYASGAFSHFMIGPYDLSASLGAPGDFTCNKYLDVVNSLKERIPITQMAVHIPTEVEKHIKNYEGYDIIAMGMDTISILEFYKSIYKGGYDNA